MKELEQFKKLVKTASDAELNAITDAYQATLTVLVMQARGVGALQEIALAEVQRRMESKTSTAVADTAQPVIVRGPYGCN